MFVIHAVQILEDLAGSVSINKETRKQLLAIKEDKAALERTVTELRSSLTGQTKRYVGGVTVTTVTMTTTHC